LTPSQNLSFKSYKYIPPAHSHHGRPQKFFQGATSTFCLSCLGFYDDGMQVGVQTLYPSSSTKIMAPVTSQSALHWLILR